MSNIESDIEKGLKFLSSSRYVKPTEKYNFVFERTNEDLDLFVPEFPITDGNIITVAGSGDQQLQIAKENPKTIHVFDRNPFAIYQAKLKTAALKSLSYSEFIDYFNYDSNNHYDLKLYEKLRENLDESARKFWDTMYYYGNFMKKNLHLIQDGNKDANIGENSYTKEENFYQTKHNLANIKILYYFEELFSFFKKLPTDKKYDAIFLSNIYDWLSTADQEEFSKLILGMKNILESDGMVALYSAPKNCYHRTELENIFKNYIDIGNGEKVLVYKK